MNQVDKSHERMSETVAHLTQAGKGILAADESTGTIAKRFETIQVVSTEDTRRDYREMLFRAPNLGSYVAGSILFEETLLQSARDGTLLVEVLSQQGVMPGIKVDKGLIDLVNTSEEKITQGLDGLPERLDSYVIAGARFAKWRAVYRIEDHLPSHIAVMTNAECLARYAAICQSKGVVPIVEPEVLIDGMHTLERCATVSEMVLRQVFVALARHKVCLEHIILKPSMVIAGKGSANQPSVEEVADETVKILKRTVPSAVPSINFLSGGQTPMQATAHLKAMNAKHDLPWHLSFSYGRALQEDALRVWGGDSAQVSVAQEILIERAKENFEATLGGLK